MTDKTGGGLPPPHAFEPLPGNGPGAHLDDDLCTDIVAGLLVREQLARVLAHVDACPACETRLMAAAGDWEAIRSRAAAEGWPTVPRPAAPGAARRLRLFLPLALAAGVLLLLLVRLPREPRHVENLSYWIPATGELLKLRAGHAGDTDSTFWVGLRAYEAHDIPAATALLEGAHAESGLDDLRRLHLASLLVNAGRADETLALLKPLDIETLPMPWREEAWWMEYLALARLGRTMEATERLARMAQWPGRIGDLARARMAR